MSPVSRILGGLECRFCIGTSCGWILWSGGREGICLEIGVISRTLRDCCSISRVDVCHSEVERACRRLAVRRPPTLARLQKVRLVTIPRADLGEQTPSLPRLMEDAVYGWKIAFDLLNTAERATRSSEGKP